MTNVRQHLQEKRASEFYALAMEKARMIGDCNPRTYESTRRFRGRDIPFTFQVEVRE